MNGKNVAFAIVFFCLVFHSCHDDQDIERGRKLHEIFAEASESPSFRGILVYQNGHLRGGSGKGSDFEDLHDVRSVTNSVVAALIGIAIEKGYIQSEDEPVENYLHGLVEPDPLKAGITIRDVLTMSVGLPGNELIEPSEYDDWISAPDQVDFTWDKNVIHPPGDVFSYNSGTAHLASTILTQATGMSTLEFAKQFLFEPMGIVNYEWEVVSGGICNGSGGLRLSSRDMVKIGQLFLDHGQYDGDGTQIVPASWIDKASSTMISTEGIQPFASGYGYFWWTGSRSGHDYFFASGWGGQFIVVEPDSGVVVAATNEWSGLPPAETNQQWLDTMEIIITRILPLFD